MVADAVGLEIDTFADRSRSPTADRAKAGISVHVGCGLYLDAPASRGSRKSSLISMSNIDDLSNTAFSKIYSGTPIGSRPEREVIAVRPLSQRQSLVASRAASKDIAVVSGAPGTGKSHVLAAMARDAVAKGESVLVLAGSARSVEVLVEHLIDTSGPPPLPFGGSRHSKQLAKQFAEVADRKKPKAVDSPAATEHDVVAHRAMHALETETQALRIEADPTYRIDVAAEVDRAGDFDSLQSEVMKLLKPSLFRFGQGRRRARIQASLGIPGEAPTDDVIDDRFAKLSVKRDALGLTPAGGTTLTHQLDSLFATEAHAATARGDKSTTEWLRRLGFREKRVLRGIARVLPQRRASRRFEFSRHKPQVLTRAAPLWVGSASDVDEVLPEIPAMFDLVIVDEAAQVDQLNVANGLVRAQRTIVCGDPNQLGHTTYISKAAVEEATSRYGTDPTLLNPRSISTFDITSSQVPVDLLEEHFRSVPHLIEFSARRFYDSAIKVATRHPRNDAADHIDITHVEGGTRSAGKVNDAEVDECIRLVEQFAGQGGRSIGLITPFRAQADALEKAALKRFSLEEIDEYGLRVGTVHSYQGDERDLLIISLAVGADEADSAWRFANQRNLFNVMITRARNHVMIVTSRRDPPGLVGDYLEWSKPLEDIVNDVATNDRWIAAVAEALENLDVPVRTGYRVGSHVVDLVAGAGDSAVAIDCRPHPDGPAAHLDRALLLRRAGWNTADAYKTKWGENPTLFAFELTERFPNIAGS